MLNKIIRAVLANLLVWLAKKQGMSADEFKWMVDNA